MEKNSTAPREYHPIEVMLLSSDKQDGSGPNRKLLPANPPNGLFLFPRLSRMLQVFELLHLMLRVRGFS
jgi:hypothetical protein